MNKKVLVISSSPRKGGNSETLAAAFAKGAQEAGNQVETVYLREKQVGFCKGCLACLKLGHCTVQDDAVEIAAKMHDADVLVFATPVYYYCVSGQLKTMTMYDMTRVNANGYFDSEDSEQARFEKRKALNMQRTEDYRSGTYALAGGVVDPLPEDAPQFVKDYYA